MHRAAMIHAVPPYHPSVPRSGLTLVDVLAGMAIIASTVAVLAPLGSDARQALQRADETMAARGILAETAVPASAAGEAALTAPAGCHLRWSSEPLPMLGGTGRLLRLCIVRADGGVLAERSVPLLDGGR